MDAVHIVLMILAGLSAGYGLCYVPAWTRAIRWHSRACDAHKAACRKVASFHDRDIAAPSALVDDTWTAFHETSRAFNAMWGPFCRISGGLIGAIVIGAIAVVTL